MGQSRWHFTPAKRVTRRTLGVCVSIVALASAATALAGPVKGRIIGQEKLVPEVYVESSRPDAHRYSWREPSPTVRSEFRTLSANPSRDVCIAALTSANAPPHAAILVKITGGHTVPTTIVVSPGTRIAFDNRDPFPHRLYIPGNNTWRAETIAPNANREWSAPPGQGRFEFRDELFPSVRSYVVVEPQVVDIAYPGHDGQFSLNNVPAGDFVLKAYFAGKQVGKSISITTTNKELNLKDPFNLGDGAEGK